MHELKTAAETKEFFIFNNKHKDLNGQEWRSAEQIPPV
jgi:hypothetical protein